MLFYFPEIAGNYFMNRKMKMYFWPVFALVATVSKINITQINKQSCGVVQIATTRLKFTMTFILILRSSFSLQPQERFSLV